MSNTFILENARDKDLEGVLNKAENGDVIFLEGDCYFDGTYIIDRDIIITSYSMISSCVFLGYNFNLIFDNSRAVVKRIWFKFRSWDIGFDLRINGGNLKDNHFHCVGSDCKDFKKFENL